MARIIDVIEAPNQGPNDIVVRVPEVGSGDFRLGSQVIVRESQTAVFYRDGKSLDVFGPGRHTITTANLPVISTMMNFFTGGNNIFTAEVYFVNMREFTDLKWGTPQPISLRDSELGFARVRGFGQYTIQIAEPKRFVDQIVGTQGLYRTSQIEDYLRNTIISSLTDVLGENMKSIFDLPALTDELSAAIRAKAAPAFEAMGIKLKQLMVVSLTPTEETARAIDERASMGAIGNMDAYLKFKAARAMGDAATSQAGGGASEGVGLGAGLGLGAGMAGMIMQSMQTPSQPAAAPAPSSAATPSVMTLEEAAAYLKVSVADVEAAINAGELKARKIGNQYRISKEAIDAFLAG
ncbi:MULTISPECIES: SPFH domain-containing protein [Caldilinea]|jgi:excisionase family DNA binding protein|uniref:Helix-turn-helix domain-containing protein n=1 Tax=Caldilinea aerophila (strain DSM 14535 / JCM 11387 / NBRC 104270 / STL-6-O1) TaxID=926550 RepID=I0I164_CALAS|nr:MULTISPECIES: SPFH domain-containing protein [Caldilinea]MBO9392745.1 SPFH domain-containing protein [Caldilinea sp.]BAL99001.1 hypothetical protein CLDAP_09620 [Caldilinea aerophila DSM 14535 = NBRC 104270]GIV74411.1 MAG: virion core protein [Caldilinea sp.]